MSTIDDFLTTRSPKGLKTFRSKSLGSMETREIQKANWDDVKDKFFSLLSKKYTNLFKSCIELYKIADLKVNNANCSLNSFLKNTNYAIKMAIGAILSGTIAYFLSEGSRIQIDNSFTPFIFSAVAFSSFYWISNEILLSMIFAIAFAKETNIANTDLIQNWVCILLYPIQIALLSKFMGWISLLFVLISPITFLILNQGSFRYYSYLAVVPFAIYSVLKPFVNKFAKGLIYYDFHDLSQFISYISLAFFVCLSFIITFIFSAIFCDFEQRTRINPTKLIKSLKFFDKGLLTGLTLSVLISGTSEGVFYIWSALLMCIVPRDYKGDRLYTSTLIDAEFCLVYGIFDSIRYQKKKTTKYFAMFVLFVFIFVNI